MICRCCQHPASVCQIHPSSHVVFVTVLVSHDGHFSLSDLDSEISDGDRLRYTIFLPRTEWEAGCK